MMNMFLKKRLAAQKNKKKGFTLIEVIVVIVIIAILAAIAVPSLTRYIGQAGLRADMATGHNIQVVLQAELSDLFMGKKLVSITDDSGVLASSFIGSGEPTVDSVLRANGVSLAAGSLTLIRFTAATAKLDSFVYTTSTSVVAYNGARLFQLPIGTTAGTWASEAAAKQAAEDWVKLGSLNKADPLGAKA